jgi:hypothetical protein
MFLDAIITFLAFNSISFFVIASPMPLDPPVINTVYPEKSNTAFFH